MPAPSKDRAGLGFVPRPPLQVPAEKARPSSALSVRSDRVFAVSVDLSPFGDVARAKALALAITLCKPEGWQRTVFYKVFWRAHLRHMLQHGRALTDWPIVRMPNGPGIEKGPELLAQLAEEGAIVQEIVPAGDHEAIVARVRDHARAGCS